MTRPIEWTMRTVGLLAILLACATGQAAAGDNWFWRYPDQKWCLSTMTQLNECGYATLQQCNIARDGVGGNCNINPRYVDGTAAPARPRRYVRR